ncbi:hypothetical protein [Roseovarius sp.]|uniref:hypothetical protein n=1 Tax=Roseovarius sp. TaxID=1486281 RepID=UPI00356B2D49
MKTTKFWKTLDELTDAATDRREWRAQLGDGWDRLSPLLTSTGSLAMSVSCPSPGGEDCPRRIVRHDDGSIRAICGDRPKACRDLDLVKDDIVVLRLDRVKLASAVARAFQLANVPKRLEKADVFQIGSQNVFAGRGFPVFLCVPGPQPGENIKPFQHIMALPGPKLLLVPTARSLPASIADQLDRARIMTLALEDCLTSSDRGFQLVQPIETLCADLFAELDALADTESSNLVWPLPADACWPELTFRFVADEVLNVSFRSETRRFEPDALGMKSAKNGRPKAVWTYLKAFALKGGRLAVHLGDPKETSKHQKQKQALSRSLRSAFGIAEDPIPTEGKEYVTRFVVSADDLRQGKKDQR